MSGKLNFSWHPARVVDRTKLAARRTLGEVGELAYTIWTITVPVETGTLRDSWFSYQTDRGTIVWLIFGASARYAIYVEVGTGVMEPRAPIRTVAGEVFPLIEFVLPRQMTAA